MEELKERKKLSVGILRKTWERCKSFNHGQHSQSQKLLSSTSSPPHATLDDSSSSSSQIMVKSKSWSSFRPTTPTTPRAGKWAGSRRLSGKMGLTTPKGCLSVYVGPEKQRFVIKVECANHPSFVMLLEEAELKYGLRSDGPLELPCDVDVFTKVLFEMDGDHDDHMVSHWGCSPRRNNSYHVLTPSKLVSFDQLL